MVSAPSGAGKTTLCERLLDDSVPLARSISATTRAPRPDERNGVDYRFMSCGRFRRLAKEGAFLEYEENFGNCYGTPRAFIDRQLGRGRSVLLAIDVKGAMRVKRLYRSRAVLIFIMPPSIAALRKRLQGRMSDSRTSISTRLALAKKEMAYREAYKYVVVNDNLNRAYRKLKEIVVAELQERTTCRQST